MESLPSSVRILRLDINTHQSHKKWKGKGSHQIYSIIQSQTDKPGESTTQKRKTLDQLHWWIETQELSTKYLQTKFKNT